MIGTAKTAKEHEDGAIGYWLFAVGFCLLTFALQFNWQLFG